MKITKLKSTIILLLILCGFISTAYSDEVIKSIPLPGHGNLNLSISNEWNVNITQPESNLPPTIEITPTKGNKFTFLITPLWNAKNNEPFEDNKIKGLVESDGNKMLSDAVEKELKIKKISGKYAKGYYFMLTDKAPKPNEYKYCIRAGIGVGNLLLSVTLLTNDNNSKDIEKAIKMLTNASQTME
jgi:hypothetical protein